MPDEKSGNASDVGKQQRRHLDSPFCRQEVVARNQKANGRQGSLGRDWREEDVSQHVELLMCIRVEKVLLDV